MSDRPYPSFLIYKDAAGEFRWKLQASNYKTIADSGEGYKNKADCQHGIDLVQKSADYPVWKTSDVP